MLSSTHAVCYHCSMLTPTVPPAAPLQALGFILKLRYVKAMLTRSTQHLWKQRCHIQYPRLSKAASMRREAAEVPRSSSSLPLPFSSAAASSGSRGSSYVQPLAAVKKLGPGGTVPPPAAVQFGAYDEVMALHEMITVMDHLLEYVMEQLQQVAWPAFERKLEQCTSLDEVWGKLHSTGLHDGCTICFLVMRQVLPLVTCALFMCWLLVRSGCMMQVLGLRNDMSCLLIALQRMLTCMGCIWHSSASTFTSSLWPPADDLACMACCRCALATRSS
jgi:hypothetical protein